MKPATSYFTKCPLVLLLRQSADFPPSPPLPLMILKVSIMFSLLLPLFYSTKDSCSTAVQSTVNFFILRKSLDSFGSNLRAASPGVWRSIAIGRALGRELTSVWMKLLSCSGERQAFSPIWPMLDMFFQMWSKQCFFYATYKYLLWRGLITV